MTAANVGTTILCGPLVISSDFDSGNILKAELIYPLDCPVTSPQRHGSANSDAISPIQAAVAPFQLENQDYEINLWTRPDCFGTPFSNGNRTWFYFSLRGGKPNGTVKINIVNLNKQTKLFMQGMTPVIRQLPDKPQWERLRDRVVINENKPQENGCSISFRQKLPENDKSTLFIAFTFPFSYLELCDLLKNLDQDFKNPKSRLNHRRELWHHPTTDNDIYYHRECVCYSLEGRRVELVTVTSVYGISEKREERLANLFPIQDEQRPFKFPGKKVVFLSARVHPGETPSSFVLNGFLRFILHKTDPRAVILRRLFVFKFIPILNPDGVFRGHYRTDPRGVNLNRVYLNPSPKFHPSIYAARKLLIYYHSGVDSPDEQQSDLTENSLPPTDSSMDSSCCSTSGPSTSSSLKTQQRPSIDLHSEDACFDTIGSSSRSSTAPQVGSSKPYTFLLSGANSLCAGCVPLGEEASAVSSSSSSAMNDPGLQDSVGGCSHQCAFEACDEDSVLYENLRLKDAQSHDVSNNSVNNMEVDFQSFDPLVQNALATSSSSRPASPRRKKKGSAKKPRAKSAAESKQKTKKGSSVAQRAASPLTLFGSAKPPFEKESLQTRSSTRSQKPLPASSYKSTSTSRYFDSTSGLFLYVDMHGHTTKRGIFMYGNHFNDVNIQSEAMLVPRIMAVNSPHFDFAACNFTERLMCVKDKKDGMSREGSGRVACLKLTGLIRSYTLECNYNTGRCVNPVVSRPGNSGIVDPPELFAFQSPKYTIELFEGVGKALAETVLDMSGQNPYSRLNMTEFKSVEGVKRSLINRLKLSPDFKSSTTSLNVQEKTGRKDSLLDANGNPIPLGSKNIKKSKILTPSGGPLGPKNRENRSVSNASKSSGSQPKNLPKKKSTLSNEESVAASSSSVGKSSPSLPKTTLTKSMKPKGFPRVSSAKVKKMKKESLPK